MKIKHALLAATLLAASATASAGEFFTYVPGSGNLTVDNPAGGAGFDPVQVTGYGGEGGQFNGNFWASGAKPADSFFRFFCAEIGQSATGGPQTYYASTFLDDELAKLYDVAYPNKFAGDFWNGAPTNFGVFGSDVQSAAFQVAVWNILFDGDLSLAGGTFQWTGGATPVKAAADAMLAAVVAYDPTSLSYTKWTLYKFQSPVPGCTAGQSCGGTFQDYVSATYKAPEAGTLALFGFTLAGFGLMARRRRS